MMRLGARRLSTLVRKDVLANSSSKLFVAGSGNALSTKDIFSDRKVLLIGYVGAFTSVCAKQFPEYAAKAEEIKSKGIDQVVAVAVNDHAVLKAFADSIGVAEDKVTFVGDFDGSFTRFLGQDIDLSEIGFGLRSKRFAAVVENGKVIKEVTENSPGELDKTSASYVLQNLLS